MAYFVPRTACPLHISYIRSHDSPYKAPSPKKTLSPITKLKWESFNSISQCPVTNKWLNHDSDSIPKPRFFSWSPLLMKHHSSVCVFVVYLIPQQYEKWEDRDIASFPPSVSSSRLTLLVYKYDYVPMSYYLRKKTQLTGLWIGNSVAVVLKKIIMEYSWNQQGHNENFFSSWLQFQSSLTPLQFPWIKSKGSQGEGWEEGRFPLQSHTE